MKGAPSNASSRPDRNSACRFRLHRHDAGGEPGRNPNRRPSSLRDTRHTSDCGCAGGRYNCRYPHQHPSADADLSSHSHSLTDRGAGRYAPAHVRANSHIGPDPDSNLDARSDGHAHTGANADSHSYAETNATPHSTAGADSHPKSNSHAHAHRHGHAGADGVSNLYSRTPHVLPRGD